MAVVINAVRAEHITAVRLLLQSADLPTADLPAGLPFFVGAFDDNELIGVAGLEVYASIGLLRSVAVKADHQQQGIGEKLIQAIEKQARAVGVNNLYLITTTAERYFGQKGFCTVGRHETPEVIAATRQFSSLCPSTALVMKKLLLP